MCCESEDEGAGADDCCDYCDQPGTEMDNGEVLCPDCMAAIRSLGF